MKCIIQGIATFSSIIYDIYNRLINFRKPFEGSKKYWINRYEFGGNSGNGSYNRLAEFKAEIINNFIKQKKHKDGN